MDPQSTRDADRDEQLRLKAVLANCPELNALTGHVRSFAHMLTGPNILRLSILIRLTWPSTTPEFQGSVSPAMTASRSRSIPAARVWRLGR